MMDGHEQHGHNNLHEETFKALKALGALHRHLFDFEARMHALEATDVVALHPRVEFAVRAAFTVLITGGQQLVEAHLSLVRALQHTPMAPRSEEHDIHG
ncbi:MAG: hypothetical protein ACYDBB_03030 [Armatimonadota bacterium]